MSKEKNYFKLSILGFIAVFILILLIGSIFNNIISKSYKTHATDIRKIIKPIGNIYTKTSTTKITKKKTVAKVKIRKGKDIYNAFCSACHSVGIANAPKLNNKSDWQVRLKQGINALLMSAKKGKNAMPPKGTCADCSGSELKSAIEFMTSDLK